MFPSPYGVSFILIYKKCFQHIYIKIYVSVSLRSIIHSYERWRRYRSYKRKSKFPSPYGVSFILMDMIIEAVADTIVLGFRLLTEYHSFLFINSLIDYEITEDEVSVSLRSIIHSYFIVNDYIPETDMCFRLLTEYHSFL